MMIRMSDSRQESLVESLTAVRAGLVPGARWPRPPGDMRTIVEALIYLVRNTPNTADTEHADDCIGVDDVYVIDDAEPMTGAQKAHQQFMSDEIDRAHGLRPHGSDPENDAGGWPPEVEEALREQQDPKHWPKNQP